MIWRESIIIIYTKWSAARDTTSFIYDNLVEL